MKLTGLVRYSPRYPTAAQHRALEAAGCHVVYEIGKSTLANCLNDVRSGDRLVVDGFHRLAATRDELLGALRQIREQGGAVMDARTGKIADPDDAATWVETLRVMSGDRRKTPEQAREHGRRGGLAGVKKAKLSDVECEALWKDKNLGTEDVLERIGLTWRTAYRRYGGRGTTPGRPRLDRTPPAPVPQVYFVQQGNRIKIGFSQDVDDRVKNFRSNLMEKFFAALEDAITATPQLARGQVWCRTCGHTQMVDSGNCLHAGWPKHCGYTMTVDSPEEQGNI